MFNLFKKIRSKPEASAAPARISRRKWVISGKAAREIRRRMDGVTDARAENKGSLAASFDFWDYVYDVIGVPEGVTNPLCVCFKDHDDLFSGLYDGRRVCLVEYPDAKPEELGQTRVILVGALD